jgi:hypothetical protein
MSGTAPELAQFKELRVRFNQSAFDFPNIDAVVVSRPDLRREDTERQARQFHAKSAADDLQTEPLGQTSDRHEAMRSAVTWEKWLPPFCRSIEQLGYQTYWTRVLRAGEYPEFCSPVADGDAWLCSLLGPPIRDVDNAAVARFSMLAADAARLILPPSKAEGKALVSQWLIHLANRIDPIVPDSQRRYLRWAMLGGVRMQPMWIPATPANGATTWWAVRLPNVFLLSRVAVEQAIELTATRSPGAPAPLSGETTLLPRWDARTQELWLGAEVVRTYSRQAPKQFIILNAFQAANWCQSIPIPPNLHGIKDAVEALNDKLVRSRLRFQRGARDTTIHWTITHV